MDKILKAIQRLIEKVELSTIEKKIEAYNFIVNCAGRMLGIDHPASRVNFVPIDCVSGNDYNPNKVAPPEMKLLEFSILKDGITMPIVVAGDNKNKDKYVVVDGFHRTMVVKRNKRIRESLRGYMPVVMLDKSLEDRMTSTVRHNVARGTHKVELSAKLITILKKHHWTDEKIGRELGMEPDEVLRLKQITGLAEAFADKEFSKAWI